MEPMKRKLLGGLAWLLAVPVVGASRLAWSILRLLASLRPKTIAILIGLGLVLSFANPLTDQLALAGLWPPEPAVLAHVGWATALGVLYHGLRSPGLARLRRSLLRRG
jgi:hypothetical protein